MNLKQEIADRIKALRVANKYTQEDIADMIGLSRVNYNLLENATFPFKVQHLYNICRIFNCSPAKLFPPIEPAKINRKTKQKRVITTYKYSKIK